MGKKELHLFWILPVVADLVLPEERKLHRHQIAISRQRSYLKAPPEGAADTII